MDLQRPHHGGNLSWAAALAGCRPQDILDFSASINPLGPPPSVRAAITQHLDDIQAYPDPSVTLLRHLLSQRHQVPMDWVMVGNGSAELLTWACRSLSETAQVHVLTPAFGDYGRALGAFGVQGCPHSIFSARQYSSSVLQDLMALDLTQAGLLLNNPHNPTGHCFAAADILKLADRARQVVLDEAFMDFFVPQAQCSLIPEIANYPQVVVLRSLTKFYSIPGLRLGYAIGHPERLQQWQSWRDPWSVNTLAIAAGVAALQDRTFQAQTYDWLATAGPQLRQGLAQLPGLTIIPGAVNFVLVRCDVSVTKVQESLLQQHHILIRDCLSFSELGDAFFRVAVRTEAENERLLQALSDALQ